ncbi:MAG: hypothetical protein AB1401_00620 [Thermodesulfobacteriota bacterium]
MALVKQTGTLEEVVDNARIDIEELRDEMESWRDNISGTGLESTEKYERVDDTADTLDRIVDALNDITWMDIRESEVKFQVDQRKKAPRWLRLQNSVSALNAASEVIDNIIENLNDIKESLDTAVSEADGVDFPTMYG